MATTKKITFVLHDETLNTHGFRMLTSGVNLEEIRKNPVMLWNHDDWELPIGKWENIRIEGTQILADANFDLGDSRAAEIARKVEAGYIKACSIGAWATASSTDPSVMLPGQEYATITEWTAREASICNIGANHNALASVALYDAYGQKVNMASATDIETIITLIDKPIKTNNTMNKDLLRLLNLTDTSTEAEVLQAVQQLTNEKQELSDELNALKTKEAEELKEEAVQLTDEAIRTGKLSASARESILRLFELNHEATKAMLTGLPTPKSVADQLTDDRPTNRLAAMSWTELDRAGKLADLQTQHPELYAEKFREQFGRDPKQNK